jgi:diguanylate cyclase (GGDEF)-like protein
LREPRVRLPAEVATLVPVECPSLEGGAGRLVDVSRSGLRLTAPGAPPLGARLSLALPGREGATTVVEALVRWWRPGRKGPGEGGLQVDPESLPAWHAVLKAHVAPRVGALAVLVHPAPADTCLQIALIGPDAEATTRLATRLGTARLAAQLVTPGHGAAAVATADVVVAGPYRQADDARAALGPLLGAPGAEAPLLLALVPGADPDACRALVEAGAFDCLPEPDGGEALARRLIVALRLCQQHRQSRAAADRLMDLSGRDPLTGLANRRQFLALAADERRRAKRMGEPLALLLLDLDHFKQVNDLYGHPAGDAALRALGRLLRRHLRPSDIVGRYGGEEFIMLLPGTDQQSGLTVADRLRALVAATAFDAQGNVRLTASIGVVASESPHEIPFAQLLASADRALYRAKQSGRNQVRPGVVVAAPSHRPEGPHHG